MSKKKTNLYDAIDLIPVDSSRINAIGYDEDSQTMVIEFQRGGKYAYTNVDKQLHSNFMKHPSKGKYFESSIKDNPNLETIKLS